MIPPRSFPPRTLCLVEFAGGKPIKIHSEADSSQTGRRRLEALRQDLLLQCPKADISIVEYKMKLP